MKISVVFILICAFCISATSCGGMNTDNLITANSLIEANPRIFCTSEMPTIIKIVVNELERNGLETSIEEARGTIVAQLLESFHEAKGYYPHRLEELTPDYLECDPKTLSGVNFTYALLSPSNMNNMRSYSLCFDLSYRINTGCCFFTSRSIEKPYWECGPIVVNP
jgi:hypothetical protein